jgi:hypothetical protein
MLGRESFEVKAGRARFIEIASAFRKGWAVAAQKKIDINLLRVRTDDCIDSPHSLRADPDSCCKTFQRLNKRCRRSSVDAAWPGALT